MIPLNHLLRSSHLASAIRRVSTTGRLLRIKEGERRQDCAKTPSEELGVKPEPPKGCSGGPPRCKRGVPCGPPGPCTPPPPEESYPWEYFLEVSVTFALLLGLSALFFNKWQENIEGKLEQAQDDLEDLKEKLDEYEEKMKEGEENEERRGYEDEDDEYPSDRDKDEKGNKEKRGDQYQYA